jgi:hypothetical protein
VRKDSFWGAKLNSADYHPFSLWKPDSHQKLCSVGQTGRNSRKFACLLRDIAHGFTKAFLKYVAILLTVHMKVSLKNVRPFLQLFSAVANIQHHLVERSCVEFHPNRAWNLLSTQWSVASTDSIIVNLPRFFYISCTKFCQNRNKVLQIICFGMQTVSFVRNLLAEQALDLM